MMASGQDVAPVPPVIAFYGTRPPRAAVNSAYHSSRESCTSSAAQQAASRTGSVVPTMGCRHRFGGHAVRFG